MPNTIQSCTSEALSLPLLEKIKLLDQLGEEERSALLKVIDMAISNKKLKDNLSNLLAS